MSDIKSYLIKAAGAPLGILGGLASEQLAEHTNIIGATGLNQNAIAHAVVAVGTFGVGFIGTWLSHHRAADHLISEISGPVAKAAVVVNRATSDREQADILREQVKALGMEPVA